MAVVLLYTSGLTLECTCEAFFDAQPGFAQRFPGGIVQFAQMAGELPEEALEDIMIAEAIGNEELGRNMPGAMPGEMLMFAEDIDDDDTNPLVEGHAPVPLQNDEGVRQVPQHAGNSGDEEESSDEEEIAVGYFLISMLLALLIWCLNVSLCRSA